MYSILKHAFNSISPITEDDWLLIEPLLKIKEYPKNDYYLTAGQTEEQIGFIIKGSFKWYYINKKGEEVNFHFFFNNNFVVDYNSFISSVPSSMNIQAMENSTVIHLPKRSKILELYSQSHTLERFGRIIAETVYIEGSLRMQNFLFLNAEERYRNLLKKHPDIFQRVSLANISSYLGIQAPSLSRIRKRISKQ